MLRLMVIFFNGLKEERQPIAGGGTPRSVDGGAIGPNSSSALLDGWEDSSKAAVANPAGTEEDSVSNLPRLEVENPLGERIKGGPPTPMSTFNKESSGSG